MSCHSLEKSLSKAWLSEQGRESGSSMKASIRSFLLALATVSVASPAVSCPPALRGIVSPYLSENGGDLCAFADRYKEAKRRLEERSVNPVRIADVRAPRFISMDRWKSHTAGGFMRPSSFDPRFIYDVDAQPRGSVWAGWDRAAFQVDGLAIHVARLSERGYTTPYKFDPNEIRRIHAITLGAAEPRIAGQFRSGAVLGNETRKRSAPTIEQIQVVTADNYPSDMRPGEGLVTFTPTGCIDDVPLWERGRIVGAERTFRYDLLPPALHPFRDEENPNKLKRCGYYTYAHPNEVGPELAKLARDTTQRMSQLLSGHGARNPGVDPIYVAARTQRWFVSIHPFNGGNGRTSRFLMDYILQSVGLPAPTLENTMEDMLTAEREWARKLGQGMERVVRVLEACAAKLESAQPAPECAEVPWTP